MSQPSARQTLQLVRLAVAAAVLIGGYVLAQSRGDKPPAPADSGGSAPTAPERGERRPRSDRESGGGVKSGKNDDKPERPTPDTEFWTRASVPGAPAKGGASVGVGSWNIEWFSLDGKQPRHPADIDRMATVIRQSGATLLGLNEIQDEAAMEELVRRLPGWKYALGTTGRQQKCAILWDATRAEVGRPFEFPDINDGVEKGKGNLRAPLVAPVRIGEFDFLFCVVHLKAMFEPEDIAARRKQLSRLRKRLDEEVTARKEPDVIVVGDFNDFADSDALKELTARKGKSGYVVTGARLDKKIGTYIPKSGRIDHVAVASPATSAGEWENTAHVFPKPRGADRDLFLDTVSDHLPTWATFRTDRDDD